MVAATHGLAAPPFSALTLNTALLRLGTSTSDLHHYASVACPIQRVRLLVKAPRQIPRGWVAHTTTSLFRQSAN